MSITVQNVTKRFGKFVALDDVSLEVPDRLAGRAAGPVRLGQDDAAADHRRAGSRPTRARCCTRTRTSPTARPATATSASCSSTTPCSGT